MAIHSSILVWRTPWTEEPGGLQSMGSHKVQRDSSTITCPSYTTKDVWLRFNQSHQASESKLSHSTIARVSQWWGIERWKDKRAILKYWPLRKEVWGIAWNYQQIKCSGTLMSGATLIITLAFLTKAQVSTHPLKVHLGKSLLSMDRKW